MASRSCPPTKSSTRLTIPNLQSLENKRQNKRTMKRTILKTVSFAAIITALAPMLNAYLLEVGSAGYDTWQITGDSGSAASTTRDQVHAVGGQLGLTYLPWVLSVNLHGFCEYFAEARFQGGSLGVSIAKKF